MYGNGSFNPSPGNGPPIQNHVSHTTLPPVQQGHPTAYMYPPPPPGSSAPQDQLITMLGTTQSYTNLSYLYPTSKGETQTTHGSSQHFQYHHHLPPVSMLPPPPLLPPGTMPPAQAFHPLPRFLHSVPSRSLEPPGMPLPPPPPRSSSPLVADITCEKPEAAKTVCENGVVLHHEGPVLEDVGSSKESSIHCDEFSPPLEKAENDTPLCSDPDVEMEDDITLPENENYPSQPLNCGSDQAHGAHVSGENKSIIGISSNFQAEIPGSKPYDHLQQDMDDGSIQASSSPYSGRVKTVSDMYDPFVDGFEPASVKLDHVQEQEPVQDSYTVPKASISSNRPLNMEENNQGVDKQALSESDTTARLSVSSNKPPEIEENTTGNDIGAVVSGNNDEFGENAENGREGNSHENGTPNTYNENLNANNNVQEGDNTRKKSRENPNEKESSRSTKLFKVVLTKFVKDLLKPSWKQGNMSKEAFKTIVKRAVDKVSNSMEGRRVPKSRAKIDRYIDTSQHKLTKLVMGYVDKYVKV